MLSEWPPTPAGTPWALIRSTIWAITSMLAAVHHVRVGHAAVRVDQRRAFVDLLLILSFILAVSSFRRDADHRLDLRLRGFGCTSRRRPSSWGSIWIVLMPHAWARSSVSKIFASVLYSLNSLRGVHQIAAVGPAADQVAADQQPADRDVADLAGRQAAGWNAGRGPSRIVRNGTPVLHGRLEDPLLDTDQRRANSSRAGHTFGQKTPTIRSFSHHSPPLRLHAVPIRTSGINLVSARTCSGRRVDPHQVSRPRLRLSNAPRGTAAATWRAASWPIPRRGDRRGDRRRVQRRRLRG